MTAANLIVGDRDAYLLSDTAGYEFDGRLCRIRSKVVSSASLRLAITRNEVTTDNFSPIIEDWLKGCPDQESALRSFPALAGLLTQEQRRGDAEDLPESGHLWPKVVCLYVAVWSERRRQPEGYVMTTAKGFLPDHVRPGTLHPAREYVSPIVDRRFYPGPNFDPERDGLRLLEAQRLLRHDHGRYVVGGAAELTTVSEAGVSTKVLRRWPDEVGRPIDPRSTGRPKLRMLFGC